MSEFLKAGAKVTRNRYIRSPLCVPVIAAALVLAMAACSSGSGSTGGGEAQTSAGTGRGSASGPASMTSVTVRTDYLFNGYLAPLAVAVKNGYFKQQGLNVKIGIGQGSSTTIQTVASGRDDFGFATADLVSAAITDHNVPVKVLAVYLQKTPNGIVYRKSETNGTVKDILQKGMTEISCAGCEGPALWAGAVTKAGLPTSEIKVRRVASSAESQAFLATKHSYVVAFGPGNYLTMKAKEPDANFISLADLGIQVLSDGLITSNNMLDKHPQTVSAFVKAYTKAWQYAIEHPNEAAKDATKYSKQAEPQLLEELNMVITQFLHTPASKDLQVGATAESDWKSTLSTLKNIGVIKGTPKPVSSYYDGSFIPTKSAN